MNHDYIEQLDLIDRYLTGKLVAEESERFEEHFIDCPQCIDRLKITREFKRGLRLLTMEQASPRENYLSKAIRWLFLERMTWTIAACSLLLITSVIAILLFSQVRRLRSEADQAKIASSEWQRRYEEQQSAIISDQQRRESERTLSEQVQQPREENQKRDAHRGDTSDYFQGWIRPSINIPIVALESVRGGSNEITLPSSATGFVISIPLEGASPYPTYRMTILANDRPLGEKDGFKPDLHNALTAILSSSHFRPGDYLMKVEGIAEGRDPAIIGIYPFRIIKP